MFDYLENFKNQNLINEGLFGKLFSKDDDDDDDDLVFKKQKDGSWIISDKSTAKVINGNGHTVPEFLKNLDLRNNENLNFLVAPGTEFHVDILNIDPDKEIIRNCVGTWKSGPFIGETFRGIFKGSSFHGLFVGKYSDYMGTYLNKFDPKSSPLSFVDGRFQDTTDSGILGLPNTVSLNKSGNRNFNFITIPVGHTLQFRSQNGIEGSIKVLKRLDLRDSNFRYEIVDGFKGQDSPELVSLSWTQIKQKWKYMDINSKSPRNIADLISVPEGDSIIEMYISTAPAKFKSPKAKDVKFDPNQEHEFDLSIIPQLDMAQQNIKFKFDTSQEFDEFSRVGSYIKSGLLSQDIKNVAKAIKYGEVDGYGPFNYLSTIFGLPGKNIFSLLQKNPKSGKLSEAPINFNFRSNQKSSHGSTPPVSPYSHGQAKEEYGTIPSMSRLNDFIKYFVENISDLNKHTKEVIIKNLKKALNLKKVPSPKSANNSSGTQNNPGFHSTRLEENVRNVIRGIIKDNF